MTIPTELHGDLSRLHAITNGCRSDMHEPGEQNLKARVVGDHLDNACGEFIGEDQITRGYQEFVVVLERIIGDKLVIQKFNLATLIALARFADA